MRHSGGMCKVRRSRRIILRGRFRFLAKTSEMRPRPPSRVSRSLLVTPSRRALMRALGDEPCCNLPPSPFYPPSPDITGTHLLSPNHNGNMSVTIIMLEIRLLEFLDLQARSPFAHGSKGSMPPLLKKSRRRCTNWRLAIGRM